MHDEAQFCGELARQSCKVQLQGEGLCGELANHTVIYLYDKLCGVNVNIHADI